MIRTFIIFAVALMFSATAWAGNGNNGGKAKTFGNRNSCIVEGQKAKPTLEQLIADFIYCQQFEFSRNGRLTVAASENPRKLRFDVQTDEFVSHQMNTTGILSYILYKDGKIIKDAKSPQNRLGKLFNDETLYQSNSVGKSFTSYLLGHAICAGHIFSLDQTIEDWPILQNTPYEKQRLIDLVNMNVGDSMYFNSERVLFKNQLNINGVNHETIRYWGDSLRGQKAPKKRKFNYSQMISGLITNYIAFKMDGHFDDLLHDVYTNKVRIGSNLQVGYVDKYAQPEDGRFSNSIWATRYDYLRIAIAMLEDWRSDNCVGKYLKQLYGSRVDGNSGKKNGHGLFRRHHRYGKNYKYAGFFHTDISNVKGKVFGMGGFGGQYLFINFDSGTIVAINAVHDDFDTAKLVVDAINGKTGGQNWNAGVSTKLSKIRTVEEVQAIIDKVMTQSAISNRPKKGESIKTLMAKNNVPSEQTKVSKTKYDRTITGMKVRFKCLTEYAVANGIANLPSEQEIESLTTNLEGNYYYRSHRQIVKAGISQTSMDANKATLIRLVNFEGTNEEYCSKPVL